MKIVLAEEQNGQFLADKTFNCETLRIGRDPNECGIVFEQKKFPMVSRRHAEIVERNGKSYLIDQNSSFGTFLNDNRIGAPTEITINSRIRFGANGPVLLVRALETAASAANQPQANRPQPQSSQPKIQSQPQVQARRSAKPINRQPAAADNQVMPATLLGANLDLSEFKPSSGNGVAAANPQLIGKFGFDGKTALTVGRAADNDIRLEGLQISKRHARLSRTNGGIAIEDQNSTNGVYFAGKRIAGKQLLTPNDIAQIGAFQFRVDPSGTVYVFDTRSKTRLDALHLTKTVRNNAGGGELKLLDDVSIHIAPNE